MSILLIIKEHRQHIYSVHFCSNGVRLFNQAVTLE